MKYTGLTISTLLLASPVLAIPADYPAPAGGWGSIDYPSGTGENLHEYPPGTGEGLHEYPAPAEGWESVTYPPGTGGGSANFDPPFVFTSTYHVVAVGSEVRNGTTPAPGPANAVGFFEFGINSLTDTICYNITLLNVKGTYQSPAKTATHIHQAARGASGPPRLAFPNPVDIGGNKRVSVGCLTGPFTTGLNGTDGMDTGSGFRVNAIEQNPEGFFADSHTDLFTLGVVRGQLA